MEVLVHLVCFLIFVFLQALFINGWNECFKTDMIFYPIRKFLSKYIKEVYLKPIILCVKCESSVIGGITFWGTVLPVFGFNWFLVLVFIMDVFILVTLNWIVYKKM